VLNGLKINKPKNIPGNKDGLCGLELGGEGDDECGDTL
jgi:hypothetical protein